MFREIDSLFSRLKSVRLLSPESVRRLSEDFMIDYTYHSNAIEGNTNTLTLEETALVLNEGVTVGSFYPCQPYKVPIQMERLIIKYNEECKKKSMLLSSPINLEWKEKFENLTAQVISLT